MEGRVPLRQQSLHQAQLAAGTGVQTGRALQQLVEGRDAPPEPIVEHPTQLVLGEQLRAVTKRPFKARTRNTRMFRDIFTREDERPVNIAAPPKRALAI